MSLQGQLFYDGQPRFTIGSFIDVWVTFWLMALLKDVFSLHPFHRLMHGSWYFLHKTHHEVNENAQVMLALNIDFVDIILENIAAANMMLLLKYLLGFQASINIWCIFLI